MSYDLQPCQPQVSVGRWLLAHLRPDQPPERARTIVSAIQECFADHVLSVQDLSHTTPEGLSEILAIPDSVCVPTAEALAKLHSGSVVEQRGLGL